MSMEETVCRRVRERRAREEKPVINSKSSLEAEEDLITLTNSSSLEEEEGTTTPSQLDPVEDPEWPPPPQVHRPVTYSTSRRPTARPKCKVSMKKAGESSNSFRKRPKD